MNVFKLNSFKLIKQDEQMDCGVACLQMVLKHYGTNINKKKLRDLSLTDVNGVSAYGIDCCLKALDFETKIIKTDETIWKSKNFDYPIIVNILNNSNDYHYVVIYGKKKDDLLIADPDLGKYKENFKLFNNKWTGAAILLEPSQNYRPKKENPISLFYFLKYFSASKKIFALITLISFLLVFICIGGSYYFKILIDELIPQKNISIINLISVGLVCSYVIRILLEFISTQLLISLNLYLNSLILSDYFSHLLVLPLKFFSSRKKGDIISRFIDASQIIDTLTNTILTLFVDLSMFFIVAVYLFFYSKILFIITFSTIPIFIVIVTTFTKRFDKNNERLFQANSRLNSDIFEGVEGIEYIKTSQIEKTIIKKLNFSLHNYLKLEQIGLNLENLQSSMKKLTELMISALVLWVGSYSILKGRMTLGELITFNSLLTYFTTPLLNIVNIQTKLQKAEIAAKRLKEVLDEETEKYFENNNYDDKGYGNIVVKKLDFYYDHKSQPIKNISFSVKNLEKYAIIGMSGSGKSTLGKILVRLFEVPNQKIYINSKDINDIDINILRSLITYISQEDFFFNGSIYENLIMGCKNTPSMTEIERICKITEIHSMIESLPMKYYTKIEEGGENLSGGEKKRLSLARALLRDTPIYIFDEITSGLDPVLENKITKELINLNNKTIIFITHSISIAKQCDRVLALQNGTKIAEGNYDLLIKQSEIFKTLYE